MLEEETLKELGKTSFAVAVAWIVFGIIQPIFSGKLSIAGGVIAVLFFLAFLIVGIIFIDKGARK